MTDSSSTPLVTKLGIKPGQTVLLDRLPDGLELEVPDGVHVVRRLTAGVDVTLTFHTRRATLERRLLQLLELMPSSGMIWACWPKKAAQRSPRNPDGPLSDLDDNTVRAIGLAAGVVDVKVAAIDSTWSGLKLVRRVRDR